MDERLQRGIQLFNDREFFHCHEVLEEAWTPERGPRRLFLQALIHLAVGFYHCERANPAGASSQFQKGLHKLALYLPSCEGIDTARLHRETLAALERIEAGVAPPHLSSDPHSHLFQRRFVMRRPLGKEFRER